MNNLQKPHFALSGSLRHASDRGDRLPVVTFDVAEDLAGQNPTSVPVKARRLLHALAGFTEFPGQKIEFSRDATGSVVYAQDPGEVSYYVEYLQEEGLLAGVMSLPDKITACVVTPKGWAEVEADRVRKVDSDMVFVAMSFDQSMDR